MITLGFLSGYKFLFQTNFCLMKSKKKSGTTWWFRKFSWHNFIVFTYEEMKKSKMFLKTPKWFSSLSESVSRFVLLYKKCQQNSVWTLNSLSFHSFHSVKQLSNCKKKILHTYIYKIRKNIIQMRNQPWCFVLWLLHLGLSCHGHARNK